ncbi:MAG: CHASE2 domain-containing protein [Burkholderiales bacterium]|nr:CHASE2 domain-containing protein [Burkholderiales bacterium]
MRRLASVAVMACLALLAAPALSRTFALRALEDAYYDWWHVLAGRRYEPRHAALVAVDDDTLLALKEDPLVFWAPHFARASSRCFEKAGAAAIGLDFLYQASAEDWLRKLGLPDAPGSPRTYDAPLRAALAREAGWCSSRTLRMHGTARRSFCRLPIRSRRSLAAFTTWASQASSRTKTSTCGASMRRSIRTRKGRD